MPFAIGRISANLAKNPAALVLRFTQLLSNLESQLNSRSTIHVKTGGDLPAVGDITPDNDALVAIDKDGVMAVSILGQDGAQRTLSLEDLGLTQEKIQELGPFLLAQSTSFKGVFTGTGANFAANFIPNDGDWGFHDNSGAGTFFLGIRFGSVWKVQMF